MKEPHNFPVPAIPKPSIRRGVSSSHPLPATCFATLSKALHCFLFGRCDLTVGMMTELTVSTPSYAFRLRRPALCRIGCVFIPPHLSTVVDLVPGLLNQVRGPYIGPQVRTSHVLPWLIDKEAGACLATRKATLFPCLRADTLSPPTVCLRANDAHKSLG